MTEKEHAQAAAVPDITDAMCAAAVAEFYRRGKGLAPASPMTRARRVLAAALASQPRAQASAPPVSVDQHAITEAIDRLRATIFGGSAACDETNPLIVIDAANYYLRKYMEALPKGETVAPRLRAMVSNYSDGHAWDALDAETCLDAAEEIYALRTAVASARQIPEGWQPVPVEPTQEMPDYFEELLAVAPKPPKHFGEPIEMVSGGDRRDAERLDWLENEANTLRVQESPDGEHMWFEVVSYHMAVPSERVIGSGSTPRKAIDAAMARGGD